MIPRARSGTTSPPLPRGGGASEWAAAAALGALLCAAALAYLPALDGEFHFDDSTAIRRDWSIRDLGSVVRGLRPQQLLGPDRPVTRLTFALDYARGALDPGPYHRTSLALHLAVSVLVSLLVLGVARRSASPRPAWIAAVVAGAFALHPLQAEAVAFAAQRSEVLAAGLGLGALLALLAACDGGGRRRTSGLVALAAALHLLALGAKIVAVATPAVFVLHRLVLPDDAAEPIPRRLRRALLLSAPLWVLTAASVARSLSLLGPGETAGFHAGALGPWRHLLTELRVHWLYARLVVWPSGQSVDHAFGASPGLLHLPTLAALLATAAVLGGAVLLWRRAEAGRGAGWARAVAFGAVFFLVELAPSSSVVPIADPVAEHRVYLASAGLLLAIAVAGDRLLRRLAGRRAAAAGALVAAAALAALGIALHERAEVWRTDLALWTDAVAKNPASARVWTNVAFARHERGDLAQALAAYARADSLADDPAIVAGIARNLSALHLEGGAPDRALAVLARGLAAMPRDAALHNNRGAALWRLGRLDEARREAELALALAPGGYPKAHDLLGLVLADLGDGPGALAEFRAAKRLDPDSVAPAEHELAALFQLGRTGEACLAWRRISSAGWASRVGARVRAASLQCR